MLVSDFLMLLAPFHLCVCECVFCVCVCACVRACVCVRMRTWACVHLHQDLYQSCSSPELAPSLGHMFNIDFYNENIKNMFLNHKANLYVPSPSRNLLR